MNWIALLLQALAMVAPTVQAIQVIAGEKAAGKDKKDLALAAIGQATGLVKPFLNPVEQNMADAIAGLVSHTIDSTVESLKTQGTLGGKISAGAAAATMGVGAAAAIANIIKGNPAVATASTTQPAPSPAASTPAIPIVTTAPNTPAPKPNEV